MKKKSLDRLNNRLETEDRVYWFQINKKLYIVKGREEKIKLQREKNGKKLHLKPVQSKFYLKKPSSWTLRGYQTSFIVQERFLKSDMF